MEPWLLGLIISLCVVFVFALVTGFLMWQRKNTIHVIGNGFKKMLNTYFIQYITLISAALTMYDLVVAACARHRRNPPLTVAFHTGQEGGEVPLLSLRAAN